jgi:hypothetical protein
MVISWRRLITPGHPNERQMLYGSSTFVPLSGNSQNPDYPSGADRKPGSYPM